MQTPEKYRQYAEGCRRIAQQLPPNQKIMLLEIAEAWIRCAEEEERKIRERDSNGRRGGG